MNWKFWKKNKPTRNLKTVQFSTLYRWYCYDVGVKDLDKLDTDVGLTPISDDAKEMELRESDERMLRIAHLMPFLEGMAEITSVVFVESQFKHILEREDTELSDEEIAMFMELMGMFQKTLALGALVGAFSAAASLGIIDVPNSNISEKQDSEYLL